MRLAPVHDLVHVYLAPLSMYVADGSYSSGQISVSVGHGVLGENVGAMDGSLVGSLSMQYFASSTSSISLAQHLAYFL